MENLKVNLFLVSIVGAAFVWGYQKENIRSAFFSQTAPKATEVPDTSDSLPDNKAPQVVSSPKPPSRTGLQPTATPGVLTAPAGLPRVASSPTPFPSPNFPARRRDAGTPQATPTPYGFNRQGAGSDSASNPYQEFLKKRSQQQQNTNSGLSDTMNSIKSGGIRDQQITRRNAYFEKLSQQLKDLKGEQTPSPEKADAQDEVSSEEATPTDDVETNELQADQEQEEFFEEEGEQLGEEEFIEFDEQAP